jgi:hypothetical protein
MTLKVVRESVAQQPLQLCSIANGDAFLNADGNVCIKLILKSTGSGFNCLVFANAEPPYLTTYDSDYSVRRCFLELTLRVTYGP